MKVKSKITKLCEHCFTVRKKGKAYVYCKSFCIERECGRLHLILKSDPRHKQRQKFSWLASSLTANPLMQYRAMWYYALQIRYRAMMLGFFRSDRD